MKAYLVYFSPSGTTKKTLDNIAKGLPDDMEVEYINLLPQENRQRTYSFCPDDLVILGTATAGTVMGDPDEFFGCLQGNNTPLVAVGLCGGSTIGIAMKMMKRRTEEKGFKVAAMGIFIGHYSTIPHLSVGRPNAEDAAMQEQFGRDLYTKIVVNHDYELRGEVPETEHNPAVVGDEYNGRYILPTSFKEKIVSDDCILCHTCEKACPVDAIDIEKRYFDTDKCIACWACISRCPKKAISPGPVFKEAISHYVHDGFDKIISPQVIF